MLAQLIRYLFPKREFHRVPRKVTALYDRGELNHQQALVMMAGLARDPQEAQKVFDELYATHGDKTHEHIKLELRRKRTQSARERFIKLLRDIFGEYERPFDNRTRKQESIVLMDYVYTDEKAS